MCIIHTLLGASCNSPSAKREPSSLTVAREESRPMATQNDLVLDRPSAHQTFFVAVGQRVVVALESNPTTGYDWTVIASPDALGMPSSELAKPAPPAPPGSAAVRTFAWTVSRPLGPGDHRLELGYRRSFERGKAPIDTFSCILRDAP